MQKQGHVTMRLNVDRVASNIVVSSAKRTVMRLVKWAGSSLTNRKEDSSQHLQQSQENIDECRSASLP